MWHFASLGATKVMAMFKFLPQTDRQKRKGPQIPFLGMKFFFFNSNSSLQTLVCSKEKYTSVFQYKENESSANVLYP